MNKYTSILITVILLAMLSSVAYGAVNPPPGAACEGNNEAGTEEYITAYTTKFPGVWNSINETNPGWSEYSEGVGLICDSTQISGVGTITYDVRVMGLYPSFWTFDFDCGGCYNDITGLETGTIITWDKASYNKGETATITVNFNAANFNRGIYYYELSVVDPVSFEYVVYHEVLSSSYTTSFVMGNEGVYESYAYISLKPVNGYYAGIEIVQSDRLSSGSTISSFVTWNLHNFIVGQSGTLSWGISPSIYDGIYTYSVKIYNGNTLTKEYNDLNNFGIANYVFSSPGNYRTDLVKSFIFDSVISSDPMSVSVTQPQDSITVSKTSYNTSETVNAYGNKYPAVDEKGYYRVIISYGQSLTGTVDSAQIHGVYPYAFSLDYNLPVGSYYASLYGVSSLNDCALVDSPTVCYKLKDYTQFTVTSPINETIGHPDLNISWGSTQYKLWESAHFSYQNATYNDTVQIKDNLGITKYQFKVNDQGINTLYSGTVQIDSDPKYIGTWTAKIINGSNSADYKTATMQVISASQANYSNDEGIIMNWDQPIGQAGTHTLTWNTGTYSGNYTMKLVDGTTGNFIMQLPFKTGTTKAQQYVFTLSKSREYYTAQFINEQSIILSSATIQISTLGAPGSTPIGQINPDSITQIESGTEIVSLLSSKIFWALLFICGMMLAVAVKEKVGL